MESEKDKIEYLECIDAEGRSAIVAIATANHPDLKIVENENLKKKYIDDILKTIEASAKVRGTGIAKRDRGYIEKKIEDGKAIIAIAKYENGADDEFAGFCYIETWGHGKFVANSGLIVVDKFRGQGLAKKIKQQAFDLSRKKYPEAKLFGLTTGAAVMKINFGLGYVPVSFKDLTQDKEFWKGCEGCEHYQEVLENINENKDAPEKCLCLAMLYDPEEIKIYTASDKHLKDDNYINSILENFKMEPGENPEMKNSDYIKKKIEDGEAIIAIDETKKGKEKFVGFCCLESWEADKFVSISGPIISKDFKGKGKGLSKKIKLQAFRLSRERFPEAKLFSLTTNVKAMETNTMLGYKPVPLADLPPTNSKFWARCKKCDYNYVLERTNKRYCICKGMLL